MAALNLPGIGSQSIRKAEGSEGRFSPDYGRWNQQLQGVWRDRYGRAQRQEAWDRAGRQLERVMGLGGEILCQEDPLYPREFLELTNPPLLISVLGDWRLMGQRGIGVVGSRKPSARARRRAYEMGRQCASLDRVVVSGLALGCDTLAHWGVLKDGGKTIGVLPTDLSNIVPKSNGRLARKILESGGLLISEYFSETPVEAYHFVQRNRLIAALSQWLIVVEAAKNSGTMHTVRMARELQRRIGVLVTEEGCMGEGSRQILDRSWGCPLDHLEKTVR